ncbi:molecular chaperone HscC [Enterococcus sp. BWR-S5]|uniref:molecular chaperone HscC n=1 Tax=Enterococcus sp. BWR-S5 TaxID=2787714 RepID=UPI001F31412D|nr:molecular chaperone HscC [Enterococcus sp. BWR-S5]
MIGIDLGTSNSVVSFWDGDQIKLIPNRFGKVLTPSVVGVDDDGKILIGEIAKERLISHPQLTAAAFKRFMGTQKQYQLEAHSFSPTELSSLVLKSLKEDAEEYLKKPCTEAVISVPAYFNNIEREATIEAAKLAGLDVQNLVSEPTAAALAYGLHKDVDQSILVIDLGGGTFDVSLLEMFSGVMQVEAISGDNQLGGEDFTQVIIQDCLRKNDLAEQLLSAETQAVIYKKAERLKIELSSKEKSSFSFENEQAVFDYELTVQDYEQLCLPLLKRMRQPIGRVLNDGRIDSKSIDQMILIGGATKNPSIKNYFSRLMKIIPYTQINPDEAVGQGAGIQAALKTQQEMVNELMMTDVCAHSLGVDVVSQGPNGFITGVFEPIIERNTTIPVSKIKTFLTLKDNQKEVLFSVYQGEHPMVKNNLKIGELALKLPPRPADTPVDCRFTYDSNGVLEVIVTDVEGNENQLIIESHPGKLNAEQLQESLQKMEDLKIHPRDRAENRLLLAKLERAYTEALGDKRQYIQRLILEFQQTLEQQDDLETKRLSVKLLQQLNAMEEEQWT